MNISADVPVLLHQAFESDRSIAWTIVKTVKRAIAGNTQGVGLRAHAILTPNLSHSVKTATVIVGRQRLVGFNGHGGMLRLNAPG